MATKLWDRKVATVQTTDATKTTVLTYAVPDETVLHIFAHPGGMVNGGGNSAFYEVIAAFKRTGGGNVAQVGSTLLRGAAGGLEDDMNWTADIEASGTNVIVTVTGVAATTIDWICMAELYVYTP